MVEPSPWPKVPATHVTRELRSAGLSLVCPQNYLLNSPDVFREDYIPVSLKENRQVRKTLLLVIARNVAPLSSSSF